MFHMPISSPIMTTIFGFLSSAFAAGVCATPNSVATIASPKLIFPDHFIATLQFRLYRVGNCSYLQKWNSVEVRTNFTRREFSANALRDGIVKTTNPPALCFAAPICPIGTFDNSVLPGTNAPSLPPRSRQRSALFRHTSYNRTVASRAGGTMRHAKRKIAALLFSSIVLACLASADTLKLTNGQVIYGVFMSRNNDAVQFLGPDGTTRSYPTSQVAALSFGPIPSPSEQIAATTPPPPREI